MVTTWSPRKASLIGKNLFLDRSVWLCSICKDENRYKLKGGYPRYVNIYMDMWRWIKTPRWTFPDNQPDESMILQNALFRDMLIICGILILIRFVWEIETQWFVEFWLRPLWNSLFLLAMQLHLSDFVRNPKENLMAFFPLKTSWLWKPCVLLRPGQGCGTRGS